MPGNMFEYQQLLTPANTATRLVSCNTLTRWARQG